jgi:hypothetical protein
LKALEGQDIKGEKNMKLRCRMDGLIVPARVESNRLLAWDGEESFEMGKMEASFYEIVEANQSEWQELARKGYRILRWASDFKVSKPPIYPTNY